MRLLAFWIAFLGTVRAQLVPSAGRPIRLEFQCTEEDMQWAGMSCSEDEPCPVFLEIASLEVVGNRIFCAGNIHSASTTLYSVLLSSADAGKTWREAHERIRGAGLDQVQFIDFETGWIGGQMLQPLSQDPFFLLTSDGGQSWRRRPVFGESRAVSIQQFWFDSRSSGRLVIDRGASGEGGRYELYESPNGGETWMIRETSERPIGLKRPASSGNADWRLRADGPSKSFRIERHQVGHWALVAAFLVPIGECKPTPKVPPQELVPEPAIEEKAAPKPPSVRPSLERPPRQRRAP